MSRISPGPLGVSCQPQKCDSYSLLCASAAPRSQDSMQLELTVLNVHTSAAYMCGIASSFCITDTTERGQWGALAGEDPLSVFTTKCQPGLHMDYSSTSGPEASSTAHSFLPLISLDVHLIDVILERQSFFTQTCSFGNSSWPAGTLSPRQLQLKETSSAAQR